MGEQEKYMAIDETIITGRKYRVKSGSIWKRLSFWTKAADVECEDGKTVEEKIGPINGITDDTDSVSSDLAASAKAVKTVKDDVKNSINSFNISGTTVTYTKNDGTTASASLSIPDTNTTYTINKTGSIISLVGSDGSKSSVIDADTTYTLANFGITSTPSEINKLHGLSGSLCTEEQANQLISQKIPSDINGSIGNNSYNIGSLIVAWGTTPASCGENWAGADITIGFNNTFSNSDTYQFLFNVDGALKSADITDKQVSQVSLHVEAEYQGGGEGNVNWIVIGY